jgi:hypothetical protein
MFYFASFNLIDSSKVQAFADSIEHQNIPFIFIIKKAVFFGLIYDKLVIGAQKDSV